MDIKDLLLKVKYKTHFILIVKLYINLKIFKYKIFSNCSRVKGTPIYNNPVLMIGFGEIVFEGKVNLGVYPSPYFYNTYIHIEARNKTSKIIIKNGVWINNNACILSDGGEIVIEENTLIGANFTIIDSDFHDLHPLRRKNRGEISSVKIEENVFIGNNVTVLKGVIIGKNSIIANGSIVTKSIPENVIAGGNPCKIIKPIDD